MSRLWTVLGLARICLGLAVIVAALPVTSSDAEAGKRTLRAAATGAYVATRSRSEAAEKSEEHTEERSEESPAEAEADSESAKPDAAQADSDDAAPASSSAPAASPAASAPRARAAAATVAPRTAPAAQTAPARAPDVEVPGCSAGMLCTVCIAGCGTTPSNIVHAIPRQRQ